MGESKSVQLSFRISVWSMHVCMLICMCVHMCMLFVCVYVYFKVCSLVQG